MNAPDIPPQTSADDPRCTPIKLTQPIPVGDDCEYPAYTHLDHDTWQKLYARQLKLLPGRAADEYLTGLALLGLDGERIPPLAAVSRKLYRTTGWKIARTPGLLDAHDFFTYSTTAQFSFEQLEQRKDSGGIRNQPKFVRLCRRQLESIAEP